jgi:sigma-B regulation protein RsbU (phosphoserine phosphatase)
VDRLDAPGLLIGLQPEAQYGCEQIVLDPGDVLLCYTDGVTEASGLNGERYEEERLIAAFQAACRSGVGAQGILDQLFARLDRFVGAERQLEDDASMVVLKVREEVMLPPLPLS